MEEPGPSDSSNAELLKLKTALKTEKEKNSKLYSQIFDLDLMLSEALNNQEENDKLRKDLEAKLESEKSQKKEEQLKLESIVYQISKQYNEILENMVDIGIGLDQGRSPESSTAVKVEFDGMEKVSRILKSLKEKIELLEEDSGNTSIGSVLTELVALGGMVRRMKNKRTPSTSTSRTGDAANLETPTSSTTIGNDGHGEEARRSDPSIACWLNQGDNCSEDISFAEQIQLEEYGNVDVRLEGVSFAEQLQFLEYRDDGGDGVEMGTKSRTQPKQSSTPGTSVPVTSVPLAPPSPVASISGQAQAEQFSLDASTTSGDSERLSGRLRTFPRKTYLEQLEGCVVRNSGSGPRLRQSQSQPSHCRPMQRKRRPNDKEGPPGHKKKRRKWNHICPNLDCGKRFSTLRDWDKHMREHNRKEQKKKDDKHGGAGSNGNGDAEKNLTDGAPSNRKGSSFAQTRTTPRAVCGEGEMLCTDGVTISVSRKRPSMEQKATSRTYQGGSNFNQGSSSSSGQKVPGPAAGSVPRVKVEPSSAESKPRVKIEPSSASTNQVNSNVNQENGVGGEEEDPGPRPTTGSSPRVKKEQED